MRVKLLAFLLLCTDESFPTKNWRNGGQLKPLGGASSSNNPKIDILWTNKGFVFNRIGSQTDKLVNNITELTHLHGELGSIITAKKPEDVWDVVSYRGAG